MTFRTFFFFGFAFERQAACSPKSKHWRAHTQQIVHPHMNTLRWTLLLTVLLTVLLLAFATSLTLLIQNALHDGSSPSYTPGDQLAWRRVSNTNTPANDDVVESASPVANTFHDFFSTTCQLRSAAFFTINGNQCYSIVYAINVPSWPLANGSQVSRQGYYGVSCDSPNMYCCGGVTRTQSEASSGNVLLPCWVSKDPSYQFVYFGLPPYSFFPSTMAIAMMVVSASTLLAFVTIIVVISRWTRAEEIRRQFAFYGRWIAKKTRKLLCIDGPLPTVRRIAVHGPTEGDTTQQHAMVTIHGNQMSILDTTYASKVADSLSDPSFREAMKEACVVCLEPLGDGGDSVALLPCGHMFHAACINDVFNMRLNAAETPCCVCQRNTRLVDITLVSVPSFDNIALMEEEAAVTLNNTMAAVVEFHQPVDEAEPPVNPIAIIAVDHP